MNRALQLLDQVGRRYPGLSFGQLVEKVEDTAWDIYEKENNVRYFSRRLNNLPDEYLRKALIDMLTS